MTPYDTFVGTREFCGNITLTLGPTWEDFFMGTMGTFGSIGTTAFIGTIRIPTIFAINHRFEFLASLTHGNPRIPKNGPRVPLGWSRLGNSLGIPLGRPKVPRGIHRFQWGISRRNCCYFYHRLGIWA